MAETFPYRVKAVMKFKAPPGSAPFAFAKGDEVFCTGMADDDGEWLNGRSSDGSAGVFPSSFVQRIEDDDDQEEPPAPPAPAAALNKPMDEAPASSVSPVATEPAAVPAAAAEVPTTPTPAEVPKPTPTRQPSLPPAASSDTAASPPEVAKKPGSLRDRIAALNAAGAGAGGPAPPPVPRAKPAAFKHPSIPVPAAGAPTTSDPTSPVQSSAPTLSSSSPPERSTIKGAMSAEDAKESIGKGGTLKDRIAALQIMTLDTPAAPGRAPKPWKKKSVEVEEGAAAAEGEATSAEDPSPRVVIPSSSEGQEGQVKDSLPTPTETTAQSPGAEVPQFEPASPADSPAPAEAAHPFVAPPLKEDSDIAFQNTEKEQEATSPVAGTADEPKSAEDPEEDDETARRSAIAARMAGLGGQRVGMAMPALPKRAGPPRRRAPVAAAASQEEQPASPTVEGVGSQETALPDAPAPVPSEEIAAPETLDESTPIGDPTPAEEKDTAPAQDEQDSLEREVAAPVTLGKSTLLASDQAEEDSDGDDFDTPALPKGDSDDEFDTPSLPAASAPVSQPSQVVREAEASPVDHEIGQVEGSAVASPSLPPGRPSLPPPPPPPAQEDEDDEEEESRKPDLSVDTDDLDSQVADSTLVPTSPATASRPAIPAIPASFAAVPSAPVKEPIVIPRSVQVQDEEGDDDIPEPLSPANSIRPAIPGVPASFASPASPPVKALPILPPSLRQAEVEDDAEEDQYASAGQSQQEVVDSPMDPGLPTRAPPSVPKSTSHPGPGAPSTGEEQTGEGGDDDEEEEEEEEEEDPEVARRAALAARMAKLGGMNMRMGPMMPPIGGPRKAPAKKKSAPVESAAADEQVDNAEEAQAPPRRLPGLPTGAFALPGITRPPPVADEIEEAQQADEETVQEQEPVEEAGQEAVAPPALPTGRPSSALPPRRSIPEPEPEPVQNDEDDSAPPPLPSGRPLLPPPQIADQYVDEPEEDSAAVEDHEDDDQEMPPPPPPSRPEGGLPPPPSAVPESSSLPPNPPPPGSPPSRRTSIFGKSKRDSVSSLERAPTRTSMDSTRAAGGYIGGDDSAPQRTNSTSLPALPESGGGPSFAPAQLAQFSSTLGAQMFAAAHTKLNDKNAREQGGEALVTFALSRATDPMPPRGWSFGASVLELEGSSKGRATVLNEVDEPRAGDVIVFHDTKFKHNLSTSRVGTAERPFVAVVAAWDSKKRKVKTIEVASSGAVEEGAHRMEDLKSGRVAVWRVVPSSAA